MNSCVLKGLLPLLLCLSTACGDAPADAAWRFRFAEPALGNRAELVETEIRRGGCDGETIFSTRVSPTSVGAAAPELGPGRYGFRGRARDAKCEWFAEGCADAELPRKGAIEIVLDLAAFPFPDPSCIPGDQAAEPNDDGGEGGVDDGSVGPGGGGEDGGPKAMPDSGTPPGDAGPPIPFDPRAAKCTNLDPAVVACFDFASVLDDASSAGNDAVSELPPTFETALSGQGLRVSGQRVAVADDASLNVGKFTIELWLRPDGLVNLHDQLNDITLLLDKDQQYNVGFTSQGELQMQVYRGINDSETTTASAANSLLSVGQFAYVAFTFNGTRSVIYKDGQRVDAENVFIDLFRGNGGTLHIGSGSPDITRPYDGLIDALRISKVARSDAEICASAGKTLSGASCN